MPPPDLPPQPKYPPLRSAPEPSLWPSMLVLAAVVIAIAMWMKLRARPRRAPSTTLRITQLYIYPLKSGAGVPMRTVELDRLGFRWDRRWLVVSEATKRHVSQREYPKMALITPSIDEDAQILSLRCKGESEVLRVALQPSLANAAADGVEASEVAVFDDKMQALLYTDPSISSWLGRVLAIPSDRSPLRLAATLGPSGHVRPLQPVFDRTTTLPIGAGAPNTRISPAFGDEFPVCMASEASLEAVNEWTRPKGREVEMLAFRPNIVVGGPSLKPWAEDYWRRIRIIPVPVRGSKRGGADASSAAAAAAVAQAKASAVDFFVAKAAARCVLTTVVPSEGRFHPTGEPLLSLREHRKVMEHVPSQKGGAFFAHHLAQMTDRGTIRIGDILSVQEYRSHIYDPAPGMEPEEDRELVQKQNIAAEQARAELAAKKVAKQQLATQPQPPVQVKKDQ